MKTADQITLYEAISIVENSAAIKEWRITVMRIKRRLRTRKDRANRRREKLINEAFRSLNENRSLNKNGYWN